MENHHLRVNLIQTPIKPQFSYGFPMFFQNYRLGAHFVGPFSRQELLNQQLESLKTTLLRSLDGGMKRQGRSFKTKRFRGVVSKTMVLGWFDMV